LCGHPGVTGTLKMEPNLGLAHVLFMENVQEILKKPKNVTVLIAVCVLKDRQPMGRIPPSIVTGQASKMAKSSLKGAKTGWMLGTIAEISPKSIQHISMILSVCKMKMNTTSF